VRAPELLRFLFAAAATTAGPAFAQDPTALVVRDPAYSHAQRLVNVDHGRRLNLYCTGSGSPTVVFDAGLADATMTWGLVQPAIAAKTRACSYDRAGIGFSDPANRAGSSANIVVDLHRLLIVAGIKPPFILVGHSSGGMNVRLYADLYTEQVAGMVLVDPSHEDQSTRFWKLVGPDAPDTQARWDSYLARRRACIPAAEAGFAEGTQRDKDAALYNLCVPARESSVSPPLNAAILKVRLTAPFQRALLSEQENVFYASADQVRRARRSYGDMPLVVLTRAPAPKRPEETQELRDERNELWSTLHDELASLSTQGVHRVVSDSQHYIQLTQPHAVIVAIEGVLDATRSASASAGTRATISHAAIPRR
jgi:pimeloyl-ACP methyl ester carboxylesterase